MVEQDPISIAASLAAVDHRQHVTEYRGLEMLKFRADLERYALLIEQTRPEVIIETGTYTGASARWFADQPGVQLVVTVDVVGTAEHDSASRIFPIIGHSTDFLTAGMVKIAANNRYDRLPRAMVVLDSDHSAPHVAREIELYGPLVTPGCALVVEDGLFDHATAEMLRRWGMPELIDGNGPGKAVRDGLDAPDWRRADGLVVDSQLTQNVDGWWIRNG